MLTCNKALFKCFKSVREEKYTEIEGLGGREHNHDVHGPDKQAGQEACEETGILGQAGRERQGPWSRQLAALAIPHVMTAGPHDEFPQIQNFFLL